MTKFKVYFLKGNDITSIINEVVEAHSFTSITVPSRVASTTVTFYDRCGRGMFMFGNVIKVAYEGEDK